MAENTLYTDVPFFPENVETWAGLGIQRRSGIAPGREKKKQPGKSWGKVVVRMCVVGGIFLLMRLCYPNRKEL